jgi:hypothetical protein
MDIQWKREWGMVEEPVFLILREGGTVAGVFEPSGQGNHGIIMYTK